MKTIKDLMNCVGFVRHSVSYGDSRAVLNNLDSEVIAYGYGYGGFVAVYLNKKGYPLAVSYSGKHIMSSWVDGGFCSVDVDVAINKIREDKLFAETSIDEDKVKSSMEKSTFSRPLLGELSICMTDKNGETESDKKSYKVYRLKNKKIRIEERHSWRDKYSKCYEEEFIGAYNKAKENFKGSDWRDNVLTWGIQKNTVPEEVIQEIKDMVVEKAI